MKKYSILFAAALAALVSCGKEIIDPENGVGEATPITFDLSANHPDMTKAVKADWAAGDAIFVFFDNVAAPKHLKMSYDGSAWTSAEYDGATASPGALGLENGNTGNMRAVFLPFGSSATVSASGTSFVFSKTYYTYYMTATFSYTVTDNKVSGAFNMVIPDGYVQFFVEDAGATDEAYLLGTDAVIPVGVASIAANGTITETSDKTYVDDMPGYVYDNGTDPKGYIFTGKLNGSYAYTGSYYFSKTKSDGTVRHDYFVADKTIASHNSVKLPAASNVYALNSSGTPNAGKWVPVGSGITVKLGKFDGEDFTSFDTWYTCNYNCTKPEQVGALYTFDAANAIEGITLPTKEQFDVINNSSNCSYTWLTVHGQQGTVVRANSGFLFLPAQNATGGNCWSSTAYDWHYAYYIYFSSGGGHSIISDSYTWQLTVRPVLAVPFFTVNSSGKKVAFAPGNLQYYNGTWQFASHQYDFFGESQSDTQRDLFSKEEGYTYTLPSSWRLLTAGTSSDSEWNYIMNTRSVTNSLSAGARYTMAKIGDTKGMILFPDNYTHPEGTGFTAGTYNAPSDYTATVSVAGWELMEAAGAVFLPAAGYFTFYGNSSGTYKEVGEDGSYFSESASGVGENLSGLYFSGSGNEGCMVETNDNCWGTTRRAIRPVRDLN